TKAGLQCRTQLRGQPRQTEAAGQVGQQGLAGLNKPRQPASEAAHQIRGQVLTQLRQPVEAVVEGGHQLREARTEAGLQCRTQLRGQPRQTKAAGQVGQQGLAGLNKPRQATPEA